MAETPSVTVIVLVQSAEELPALAGTLKALDWPEEVLVADAVGVDLTGMDKPENCFQLPLIGLPWTVLRYQSALSARSTWVLYLRPGQRVSLALQAEIRNLIATEENVTAGVYVMPIHARWEDVTWLEDPDRQAPDLLARELAVQQAAYGVPLAVQVLSLPLDLEIPGDGLIPWLQKTARVAAYQRLEEEGPEQIKHRLHAGWIQEVVLTGFTEGILRGRLFRDHTQRIALFIRLMRRHFQWLHLYQVVRSG